MRTMASALRLNKPKTRQIHARVPVPLASHAILVANQEHDGSLSDYIRDLIRQDQEQRTKRAERVRRAADGAAPAQLAAVG